MMLIVRLDLIKIIIIVNPGADLVYASIGLG